MNANTIFAEFIAKLANIRTLEEKEYAMFEAYDELEAAGYSGSEKMAIWNQMLAVS